MFPMGICFAESMKWCRMESQINFNIHLWLDNFNQLIYWKMILVVDFNLSIIWSTNEKICFTYLSLSFTKSVLFIDQSYDVWLCSLGCFSPSYFDALILLKVFSLSTIEESISMKLLVFNDDVLYSLLIARNIILSFYVTF